MILLCATLNSMKRSIIFSLFIFAFFNRNGCSAFYWTGRSGLHSNRYSTHVLRNSQLLAMNKKGPAELVDSLDSKASLIPIDLNEELKTSFMSYAMSTILSRALPDVVCVSSSLLNIYCVSF